MKNENFTTSIAVDQAPDVVFAAVNNVRGWWSGNLEGVTDKLGAEFTYRYKDIHWSKQRVTEFVPGRKVVWRVIDSRLTFIEDQTEWTGTEIVFEISRKNEKIELRFTHVGLLPQSECYNACFKGWSSLIKGNLRELIESGAQQPDVFAEPARAAN